MANKISEDPRIDKRIKDVFGLLEVDMVMTEHTTREEMLAEETEEAKMGKAIMEQINNAPHYKEVVPSDGLSTVTKEFISDPDGNTIKIQYIRPTIMKHYLVFIIYMEEVWKFPLALMRCIKHGEGV